MGTSTARMLHRGVYVVLGVWMLAIGVAGFLGWPRPFDPSSWWIPLMFCAIGLTWTWRGVLPHQRLAAMVVSIFFFVLVLVIWLADVPFPL